MLKKLTCLLLCLVFVVPMLASCNKSEDAAGDIAEEAARYTTTLNMWMITEDGTDPEQAAEVNKAINKITKQDYKTQVNIKLIAEKDYYAELEKAFEAKKKADEAERQARKEALEAQKEALKRGETIPATTEEERGEETFINEFGIPELKYPEVPDYQIDILFINNFEKYTELVQREKLASMDDLMANSANRISYYINSIFRDNANVDGLAYALPNNHAVGEYTFLIADTQLMEDYHYSTEQFPNSSIYDKECYDFLNYVKDKGITPIYAEGGKLDLGLVHYWSFDLDTISGTAIQKPDQFSLYGTVFNDTVKRGDSIGSGLIFNNLDFERNWKYKVEYEERGFVTGNPEERTAVRIEKGGYKLKEEYEKAGYTVMVMEAPRATNEDVYNSMFAIGADSVDPARAMEVITDINTNPALRNLLQYGIEGVNYTLGTVTGEDGVERQYVIPTETNAYHMDIMKTGNCFVAYPDSADKVEEWEYHKKQNLDATTYPTLGMYFDGTYDLDTNSVRIINAVSAKVKEYLDANITTVADVNAFLKAIKDNGGDMATYLMTLVGDNVQYLHQEKGKDGKVTSETRTITASVLSAAMTVMRNTKINETAKTQSPYALYTYWRESGGFNKKPVQAPSEG